jgi:uncharacterized protein YecE (DUF72 family)
VEINTTFHGVPREETFQRWAQEAPAQFVCSLKAPQTMTHERRLVDIEEEWRYFYTRARTRLGATCGPILFQLPPTFDCHLDRLQGLCTLVAGECRAAVEFRHADWFRPEVFTLLRTHNMALVCLWCIRAGLLCGSTCPCGHLCLWSSVPCFCFF